MSKELKISNVLDTHLSPIQIDGASVPIELSTDAVRFNEDITVKKDLFIEGDLSVLGKTTNINFSDDVSIDSSTIAGYISLTATGFSIYANLYTGGDGDSDDNDALITLHSSDTYDSALRLYNASSLIWSIGNDGTDNNLKLDYSAATGGATKLALDSSGNSKQEGSISIKEKASAVADTAAYGQLWVKSETPNELYFTTDAGDDIQLTDGTSAAGGGGGTSRWAYTGGGYKTNNNSSSFYYFQHYQLLQKLCL